MSACESSDKIACKLIAHFPEVIHIPFNLFLNIMTNFDKTSLLCKLYL